MSHPLRPVLRFRALSLALLALAVPLRAQSSTADYLALDNIEESWVNLNITPVRPMVMEPDQSRLWAVNVHGSQVQEYTNNSGQPSRTIDTPLFPVSLARWNSPEDGGPFGTERLLVVCRGSYVLGMIDLASGELVGLLDLPPEPGDILVDPEENVAFVSCTARDEVVEIDLVAMQIVKTYKIPGKQPLNMCFDPAGDVIVAPLISGNNSVVHHHATDKLQAGPLGILDTAKSSVASQGLPDQDAFRIDRAAGTVVPFATGLGTIMFTNGFNPAFTGDNVRYWQLNTEANNKDPQRQSEAAIRGEIVFNRLSIFDPNNPTSPNIINLDDTNPSTSAIEYDPSRTIGQPTGLCFTDQGYAFLCGILTDNVMLLDPNGGFVMEWDLPDGSIPRAVLYSSLWNVAFVYCWGTNRIEAYSVVAPPVHVVSYDLGRDPLSPKLREGRATFYDASHSQHNNASCASCHVDGRSDMLAWNLGSPSNDKGPLVTQTLFGIDRTEPFHWRGEQQIGLIDFDPAFVNLLGASSKLSDLPGNPFEEFEAYVLSLRNPANPNENETRVVDDSVQPPLKPGSPVGNAVQGQQKFVLSNSPLDNQCILCHLPPTGGSGEVRDDGSQSLNSKRQRFDVAHFFELYRKEQDADAQSAGIQLATVTFNQSYSPLLPATDQYPLLGAGLAHAGQFNNLQNFVELFFPGNTQQDKQDVADITAFVNQWDQGLAPAVHKAFMVDESTASSIAARLDYLEGEALKRNCDIAVLGTVTPDGFSAPVPIKWTFDRATSSYLPDRSQISGQPFPPQTLDYFLTQASKDLGRNVFVGLPVGTAELFAVDRDGDDLFDGDEVEVYGTDPTRRDSDGDGFWDGHEVKNGGDPNDGQVASNDTTDPSQTNLRTLWFNQRQATIVVETDEPTTIRALYSASGLTQRIDVSSTFAKQHRVVLDELVPSSNGGPTFTFSGTVEMTDLVGRQKIVAIPSAPALFSVFGPTPITTPKFGSGAADLVIDDLHWTSTTHVSGSQPNSGTLSASASFRVARKTGGPPAVPVQDAVAIFRVFKNGDPIAFTSAGAQSFSVVTGQTTTPYASLTGAVAGPFLVADVATDSNGDGTASFSIGGLNGGDEIVLGVEFVGPTHGTFDTANPVLESVRLWSVADTAAQFRAIETTH